MGVGVAVICCGRAAGVRVGVVAGVFVGASDCAGAAGVTGEAAGEQPERIRDNTRDRMVRERIIRIYPFTWPVTNPNLRFPHQKSFAGVVAPQHDKYQPCPAVNLSSGLYL